MIEIDDRNIDYDCPVPLSQGQGIQFLFVHGASFNRHVWNDQMAHFARTDTPVCMDLAGHGGSSGPLCRTVEEHCALVEAFAGSIGLSNFVLVGHSMGGAIAQAYAGRNPDNLRALVLVSTAPAFDIPADTLEQWADAPETYRQEEIDVIVAPGTGADVRRHLLTLRDGNPAEVQHADLMACSQWDNRPGFADIRHPVLLITAEFDPLLEANRAMHGMLSQSSLVVLKCSGHMMSVEEPQEVNQAIETFVQHLR